MEDQKDTVMEVEMAAEEETLEPLKFVPLKLETQEMRFLVLPPHRGDPHKPLECFFSYEPLETCTPYTAVINTRGNPMFSFLLSIDGFGKEVRTNIMFFLKHIRTEESTLRLWFRDCCLNHDDPEEKSHYWTQEWMQTMNTHASNIIDLSESMAALWDKGELPRPFTPRPKQWLELREPNDPKHYPIPIGSWRGWDAPPTPLQHLPLDYVMDEIRLVKLMSAQDKSSRLVAAFAYTPMHDGTVYHAVSYTWGEEEATDEILLNGQVFFIRKNLDTCLRSIRAPDSNFVIWIDAICIDQKNIQEKNRQLPRMLEIYEAAEIVLIWIGEPDEASKVAFALINDDELRTPKLRQDGVGNWKVKDIESFPQRLAALYRFLLRPYFRRVWVIQELAASSNPTIDCGEDMVSWSRLDQATHNLMDILHRDVSMPGKMMKADPTLQSVSDLELSYVRRLSYFRHLRVRGYDSFPFNNQWAQINDDSPGILDAVILARDFHSTSPHDKIFAVWNLAQDTDGMDFKLDYSKSLSQTFLEFAMAVAKKNNSLDIICAAEPFTRDGLILPSWCPDWSTPSTVSSMVRRELVPNVPLQGVQDLSGPIYSAAGSIDLTSGFNISGTTLECAGTVYDRIRLLGPYEANFNNTQTIFLQWLTTVHRELGSENSTWAEMMSTFWSMLAGDVAGVWGVKEVEGREGFFGIECLKQKETRYQDFWTPDFAYRNVTRGRRLVITANGFMGLAPWYAEEGQELAILSGCSAPVLLHENDDGTYRLIGSCFIQGWMEGEMLEFYGSTAEEAWDNIEAQGRLKIV